MFSFPEDLRMSWIVDLAGKAEDFLNKVDQGAANSLTKSTQKSSLSYNSPDTTDSIQYSSTQQHGDSISSSPHGTSSFLSAAAGNIKKSKSTVLAGTANVSSTMPLGSSSKASKSSNFVRPKKPEVNDDLLFDFLNSSDPPQSERKEVRRETGSIVLGPAGGSAQTQMPPISVAGDLQMGPSFTAPLSSTQGLSRNSSLSSLSNSSHSVKTEDGSRDQSQGTKHTSFGSLHWPES